MNTMDQFNFALIKKTAANKNKKMRKGHEHLFVV